MMPPRRALARVLAGAVWLALPLRAASACSVCGGDPNSQMGRSAVAGIAVLLGVIGFVLCGFATAFVCWARRIRRITRAAGDCACDACVAHRAAGAVGPPPQCP